MNILDVEIYIKQFIDFFEKNPNDLIDLIGDNLKDEFYKKAKQQCIINYEKGDDITLTRKQLISIVIELKKTNNQNNRKKIIDGIFQKTKFGQFCLN